MRAQLDKIKIDRQKVIVKVNQRDITEVYDIGDQIGQGGYGKVYKAIHKESGATRAIKKIKKKKTLIEIYFEELNILNIV